jgi:hypothetical protein
MYEITEEAKAMALSNIQNTSTNNECNKGLTSSHPDQLGHNNNTDADHQGKK